MVANAVMMTTSVLGLRASEHRQQLEPVLLAEAQVEEREIEGRALDGAARAGDARRLDDAAAGRLEARHQRRADVLLVVDDEHVETGSACRGAVDSGHGDPPSLASNAEPPSTATRTGASVRFAMSQQRRTVRFATPSERLASGDGSLDAARGVLRDRTDGCRPKAPWKTLVWRSCCAALTIVVEHHRYHGQPVDAREIVERVLAGMRPHRRADSFNYRAHARRGGRALLHGFR